MLHTNTGMLDRILCNVLKTAQVQKHECRLQVDSAKPFLSLKIEDLFRFKSSTMYWYLNCPSLQEDQNMLSAFSMQTRSLEHAVASAVASCGCARCNELS